MQVHLDISRRDYRALNFFNHVRRRKPHRPWLILGFSAVWIVFLQAESEAPFWALFLQTFFFAAMLWGWSMIMDRATALITTRWPITPQRFMGTYTLDVDDEGIHLKRETAAADFPSPSSIADTDSDSVTGIDRASRIPADAHRPVMWDPDQVNLRWKQIAELIDDKRHFFLMRSRFEGLIVPKRAFGSERDAEHFLIYCLRHMGLLKEAAEPGADTGGLG